MNENISTDFGDDLFFKYGTAKQEPHPLVTDDHVYTLFNTDFFYDYVALGKLNFLQVFQIFAMQLMFMIGVIIKGGLFTSNSLLSTHIQNDGGVLCIQYTEQIILNACTIVYNQNIVQGGVTADSYDNGPFLYRVDPGYNTGYMVADLITAGVRIVLLTVSMALYCPDYFEKFLSSFDDQVGTANLNYRLTRNVIDLISQIIIIFIILSELIVSFYSWNPILIGLRAGEFVGQTVFVWARVEVVVRETNEMFGALE